MVAQSLDAKLEQALWETTELETTVLEGPNLGIEFEQHQSIAVLPPGFTYVDVLQKLVYKL